MDVLTVSVTHPSSSPHTPHQPCYNVTNHPLNIWECHLPQMMETSAPDTAAIRYGNLTASCFANQLAKKGKKRKTLFPM